MPEYARVPVPAPSPTTYTLFCPPHDTSPAIARDFVATVLRARRLDALVDAAALCTSELVTNACVHAKGGNSALWLAVGARSVRVLVFDEDEKPPVARESAADAWDEGGRGLHLVHTLTEGRWGTAPAVPHGPPYPDGKAVWFDLGAPGWT
ncbi:ATP-binding protein [Streptomyces adelaidensis]|uniref:ATP-binding protein n=1 Tax=Streptomyces adelaidensis TaxID=2796465 RepID=UPI00190682FD|nr:ATP-binding protein [Streptomyces adelaidensis]